MGIHFSKPSMDLLKTRVRTNSVPEGRFARKIFKNETAILARAEGLGFKTHDKRVTTINIRPPAAYKMLGWVQVTSHSKCITCVQVSMYLRRRANSHDLS